VCHYVCVCVCVCVCVTNCVSFLLVLHFVFSGTFIVLLLFITLYTHHKKHVILLYYKHSFKLIKRIVLCVCVCVCVGVCAGYCQRIRIRLVGLYCHQNRQQ